ncbi:putative membrane protein [Burkholderia sp. MSHR3999]|uniref:hypothetical protein n=1 Tax=Burkholderia sp. MSHR3999 TaxID=1542965 RepID=UPI0005AC05A2|nr:hypothetical protein [Burkholderia sp. MSHR3999]KIP17274.1 putative membrane protein [Burkholderia sp. MSHR3999]
MDTLRYTDRFIANLLVSWLVTCWVVMVVDCYAIDMPWLRNATARAEIGFATVVAIVVLFVVPVAFKFVCRIRPSIFDDDDARKASWRGRLIGMGVGLVVGIAIQGM